MNSLIGLGAATSFTAGSASLLLPGAGLEVGFMEEPVMLLAFVLLGRALETRARLKASGNISSCLLGDAAGLSPAVLCLGKTRSCCEVSYQTWVMVCILTMYC